MKVTSVSPSDLRLKVDYPGDLLTWESSSCGTGGGITPDSAGSQARLVGSRATIGPFGGSNKFKLKACKTGTATLRLLTVSGNTELDTVTVRITTETIDPPPSSPSISISDLASSVKVGLNDSFTVSASHLSSSNSYSIRVTTNNSDIGFNNTCSDRQEDVDIPAGRTSYSKSLTLHGCDTTSGTVSAILRRDGTDIAVDSQHVTVTVPVPEPPTNLTIRYHETATTSLVVSYTHSTSNERFYQFELHKSATVNGTYAALPKSKRVNVIVADPVFHDLEPRYWYKAMGKNCTTENRTGCGDWSNLSDPMYLPTLTAPRVSKGGDNRTINASYSLLEQSLSYKGAFFQLQGGVPTKVDSTESELTWGTTRTTFTPTAAGEYKFGVRICVSVTSCGPYFYSSNSLTKLAPPTRLDVVPLQERRARFSWQPSANENRNTRYYVVAEDTTGVT